MASYVWPSRGQKPWDDQVKSIVDSINAESTSSAAEIAGRLAQPQIEATAKDALDGPLSMIQGARFLVGRLEKQGAVDLDAITADAPTITNGTSSTISGRVENANSESFTSLGRVGEWLSGATDVDGEYTGREFYMDATAVEFSWKARGTNSARFVVLVDDLPTSLTPITPPGTTTAGATYYMKLTWGAAKRRKVTVLATRTSAWGAFRFTATTDVQPTPKKPVVTAVAASFDAGFTSGDNTSALQGIAVNWSRLLGVDVQIAAREGTGFLNPGSTTTYGDPTRIARGVEKTPELIVFTGSGNDLGSGAEAQLKTAATATFDAWAAAAPGVPMIVFGIPPRNATDTIAETTASMNHALREAALEHPAVIAFHDLLGIPTATLPAAHSSGFSGYVGGDLVSYLGSVWQLSPHITGSTPSGTIPGTSERWRLKTVAYTGTGKFGTATGDGTRDVLLSADGTHPTPAGFRAFARNADSAIRSTLTSL